jgi:hypothetical protein
MGYYTTFSLEVENAPNDVDIIAVLRDWEEDAMYALDESGNTSESLKWYDHVVDMRAFSGQWPDVLFILNGEGEESGDIWRKYFKNGKVQMAKAKITFDEFDKSKLE